jgi:hypothetical protein
MKHPELRDVDTFYVKTSSPTGKPVQMMYGIYDTAGDEPLYAFKLILKDANASTKKIRFQILNPFRIKEERVRALLDDKNALSASELEIEKPSLFKCFEEAYNIYIKHHPIDSLIQQTSGTFTITVRDTKTKLSDRVKS